MKKDTEKDLTPSSSDKSISQSWITIVIQGGTSVAVNGPKDSLLIGSFSFE